MSRLAVVVGCKHCEDDLISDLKYADRDATKFAELLIDKCGFQSDEIFLLNDQCPREGHEPRKPSSIEKGPFLREFLSPIFNVPGLCRH
jgi:Caspase domain